MKVGIFKDALVNGELNGLGRRSCSEVVRPGFQAILPSVEVHARQLPESTCRKVNVETLTLANESAAVSCKVQNLILANLPDRLVDRLDIVGNARDILDGAVVGDDHVLHGVVPVLDINELAKKPGADDL